MKKYLIVLAAALVTLASCDPKEEGSKYTSISFKEKSIELLEGETAKLRVLWEPTTITEAPACEWTSSNPEVVSVDQNGTIKALAAGEANITAKHGELNAACQVIVKSVYDALKWNMVLIDVDPSDPSTVIGEPYEVGSSTKYTVQKYAGTFVLCGEGLEFDEEEGAISGAGFISYVDCPIEIITEGKYAGLVWTDMMLFSNASPADSAGVCPEGELTDAAEWHEYLFNDSTYEGNGSFKGAAIHYIDYDNKQAAEFLGFIKNGALQDYYTADGEFIYYALNITWMGGQYGLEVDEEGEFVEPYKFAERKNMYYENLPEEEVAKKAIPLKRIENSNIIRVRNLKDTKVLLNK